jgi:hypothetical protein
MIQSPRRAKGLIRRDLALLDHRATLTELAECLPVRSSVISEGSNDSRQAAVARRGPFRGQAPAETLRRIRVRLLISSLWSPRTEEVEYESHPKMNRPRVEVSQ